MNKMLIGNELETLLKRPLNTLEFSIVESWDNTYHYEDEFILSIIKTCSIKQLNIWNVKYIDTMINYYKDFYRAVKETEKCLNGFDENRFLSNEVIDTNSIDWLNDEIIENNK